MMRESMMMQVLIYDVYKHDTCIYDVYFYNTVYDVYAYEACVHDAGGYLWCVYL